MLKKGKTKNCLPKEKERAELIFFPMAGNHMQTQQSKLKHISQGKEKEISNRCKRANR